MLTIGRMARIFGVTPKTLRQYESSGLFCPSHIDRWSGYRYYAPAQIPHLGRILRLRNVGLGLEEIARICSGNHSRDQVRAGLLVHAERLRKEIADRQAALDATDALIASLDERVRCALEGEVLSLAAFRVIGLELDDPRPEAMSSLRERFMQRANEVDSSEPGVCLGVFHGHPESELRYLAGTPVSAGAAVPGGMSEWIVPAQRYARFVHRGPVQRLADTMREIHEQALPQQGLEPADGFDFERYDPWRCPDPGAEDAEVELNIPIR